MADIDIALPAYNCAAWLDDLMESILKQDVTRWRIVARDDGSSDDTRDRLGSWKQRLGERMVILDSSGKNLGSVGNYESILRSTGSPWIMLADSDDVWRPGKMALTAETMQAAESTFGASTPLLVFTDAKVVDEKLRPLAESYWLWSRANVARYDVFQRVLVDSPALSSTMMVNRALIDLALPMTGAVYHDWWVMMVAAAFGRIVKLGERTILYRRHSANVTFEPYAASTATMLRRLLARPGSARYRLNYLVEQISRGARAFAHRFYHDLSPPDLAALQAASRFCEMGPFERRWAVLRNGLWFGCLRKNVGLMLLL